MAKKKISLIGLGAMGRPMALNWLENGFELTVHDLNRAVLMHDDVLALKQGRVVYHGPTADFMTQNCLAGIYDRSFCLTPHPETAMAMVLPEVTS